MNGPSYCACCVKYEYKHYCPYSAMAQPYSPDPNSLLVCIHELYVHLYSRELYNVEIVYDEIFYCSSV